MRWNQFGHDVARASALGNVLLDVATAAGPPSDVKRAVVLGQVAKVLGTGDVPEAIVAELDRFDPKSFDLGASCAALKLVSPGDRLSFMKAVAQVVRAEGLVLREERSRALRVAAELGVRLDDAMVIVGMPARPTTNQRPRGVPRPITERMPVSRESDPSEDEPRVQVA